MPGWHSVECHPCTLVAECLPGTSDSLWNFTLVVRKVSPQDFLLILGTPIQKLRIGLFDHRATKWCFWPTCDQNLGSVILRCDCESNFRNLDLERLRTFMPMARKVSLKGSLPLFGAPQPEITTWSFWLAWDQMLLLTSVRPKSMFSLFGRCATRKRLKNLRLMAG